MAQRLKFKDLGLRLDASFWNELEDVKLHTWKLSEPTVPLTLFLPSLRLRAHSGRTGLSADEVSATSASIAPARDEENPNGKKQKAVVRLTHHSSVTGILLNFNTINQLVDLDKKVALAEAGSKTILEELLNPASAWNQPLDASQRVGFRHSLTAALFTFADLKTHEFHYCAAFPAIDLEAPAFVVKRELWCSITSDETQRARIWDYALDLCGSTSAGEGVGSNPFVVTFAGENPVVCTPFHSSTIAPLSAAPTFTESEEPVLWVAFADSASGDSPGWGLRNILVAVRLTIPTVTKIRVLALRDSIATSVVFDIACDAIPMDTLAERKTSRRFKTNGWVDTVIHKVEMGGAMDPQQLAASSAKLNLSLMKWRMLPDLQLDALQTCKALLLGSGTLGCNIGRHLLMWGVTHLTFVDRGNVSYSNPVRQTLFELKDVIAEGELRCKSIAAANAVKRILPTANVRGVNLTIRMPGHRVDPGEEENALRDIQELERLILEHDVVFLLTDSRESRWLPTVLAALHDKPVINTALGFDTYVVMRHGCVMPPAPAVATASHTRLGCYFCNDVVAPQDSLTARSLDQQCTVTRPGVSAMASALSVEMLAALYNHPARFQAAPHRNDADDDDSDAPTNNITPLGVVPHQLRGNVYRYELHTMYGTQYNKCTACSDTILDCVRREGYSFIIRCLNHPQLMEEVTGLKAEKDAVAKAYENWDDDNAFDD